MIIVDAIKFCCFRDIKNDILRLKDDIRKSNCNMKNNILKIKNEISCSTFTSKSVNNNVNILSNRLKRVTTTIIKKTIFTKNFENLC